MKRPSCIVFLAVLSAGCATTPSASLSCKTLGCIERGAASSAPVGATLEFSKCNRSAWDSFKYIKVESGWSLVAYETVESAKCGSNSGA